MTDRLSSTLAKSPRPELNELHRLVLERSLERIQALDSISQVQANAIKHLDELRETQDLQPAAELWERMLDPGAPEELWRGTAKQMAESYVMVGVSARQVLQGWETYASSIHGVCEELGADVEMERAISFHAQSRFSYLVAEMLEKDESIQQSFGSLTRELKTLESPGAAITDLMRIVLSRLSAIPGVIGGFVGRFDARGTLQFEQFDGEIFGPFNAQVARGKIPAISIDPHVSEGQGPAGRAWRSGELQITSTIARDPSMAPWSKVYVDIGIRSAALVPILNGRGESVALMGVYSSWPGFFDLEGRQASVIQLSHMLSRYFEHRDRDRVVPHALQLGYRELLHSGKLVMVYQPIIDLKSGELIKVEALARLEGDDGELIGPYEFLSAFGSDDLLRLFDGALRQSGEALQLWARAGYNLQVSVNLPPQGIINSSYLHVLQAHIADGIIEPARLTLEITEEEKLEAEAVSSDILTMIKSLGVRLSQDDLGSGYSSLQRFNSIGFDEVKIDQAIVRNRSDPLGSLKIMQHLTQLAHDLGIAIVVEGLESPDLLEAAAIIGADLGQGFTIARPMRAGELVSFISSFEWMSAKRRPQSALGGVAALWKWARQIDTLEQFPEILMAPHLIDDIRSTLVYLIDAQMDEYLDRLSELVMDGHRAERGRLIERMSNYLGGVGNNHRQDLGAEPRESTLVLDEAPFDDAVREMSHLELRRSIRLQQQLFALSTFDADPHATLVSLRSLLQTEIPDISVWYMEVEDGTPLSDLLLEGPTDPQSDLWKALLVWEAELLGRSRSRTEVSTISLSNAGSWRTAWSVPVIRRGSASAIFLVVLTTSSRPPTALEELLLLGVGNIAVAPIRSIIASNLAQMHQMGHSAMVSAQDIVRFSVAVDDGRISRPSAGAIQFYGFSEEEFTTKTIFDISAWMTPEALVELASRYRDGVPIRMRSQHRLASGELRDIEYFTMLRSEGSRRFFDTTYVETAGWSQSERVLLSERAIIDRIMSTAAVVAIVVDPVETTILVNTVVCEMLGSSQDELLAKPFPWTQFVSGDDAIAIRRAMSVASKTRVSHSVEVWVNDVRRERRRFSLRVSPVFDDADALVSFVCTAVDLTERYVASEDARDQRIFLDKLLESISNVVIVMDFEGRIVRANSAFGAITGRELDEYREKKNLFISLFSPRFRPLVMSWYEDAVRGNLRKHVISGVLGKGGEELLFEWRCSMLADDDGGSPYIVCIGADISDQDRRTKELRRAAAVFENSVQGIVIADTNSKIIDVNEGFCRISGYSKDEIIGQDAGFWSSGRHGREFYSRLYSELLEHDHWSGTIWNRRRDGAVLPVLMNITAIKDVTGANDHFVGVCTDISDMMHRQMQLREMAFHDILTSLPNRSLLAERMRSAMAESRRNKTVLALAYLDLDNFKPVNDCYGHDEGDRLLVELSRRLVHELREVDTVARIGGDEFVCLLPALSNKAECLKVIDRLMKTIEVPFALSEGRGEVVISTSIGVVFFEDEADPDALLRQADHMMYEAKRAGGRTYLVDGLSRDRTMEHEGSDRQADISAR